LRVASNSSISGAKWFATFIDDCKFLLENGVHESTCDKMALLKQQNGIAKRKNNYLLKVTQALLSQMYVPKSY